MEHASEGALAPEAPAPVGLLLHIHGSAQHATQGAPPLRSVAVEHRAPVGQGGPQLGLVAAHVELAARRFVLGDLVKPLGEIASAS